MRDRWKADRQLQRYGSEQEASQVMYMREGKEEDSQGSRRRRFLDFRPLPPFKQPDATNTLYYTHTHTRSLPSLAPPAAALSSTSRHAAFRAGKHNAFESVGVGLFTCSRRSCYGSALLLKRQSDWLVSRGLM